jgi:hypothetical protein
MAIYAPPSVGCAFRTTTIPGCNPLRSTSSQSRVSPVTAPLHFWVLRVASRCKGGRVHLRRHVLQQLNVWFLLQKRTRGGGSEVPASKGQTLGKKTCKTT